jgi:TRAP-type mannitol/chloroaromatic compound transport system substrate-binding protein
MALRRRDLLAGVGSMGVGGTVGFPAPAIAQGIRQFIMVTDWTETMPGLLPGARRLAQTIGEATKGRIKIEVFPANAFVKALESFDAVSAGIADMFHSSNHYFGDKSPALNFYSGVPFGFTANELFAWVRYGGGQELWDELTAQFNIKALLACSTGTQMGGWFNSEITSLDAFKGLRYRMPALGAEILRRLGAVVVSTPGGEIASALKSGAIDASEWIGPWQDMAIGLHKAAGYYYYPGFHEPGTAFILGINKRVWESLDAGDQRLIEACTAGEYAQTLAEFNANNALSLHRLRDEATVKILKFDDATLKALREIGSEVVAAAGTGDELSGKIYASYQRFRASIMDWTDISERTYLNSRQLV